MTDEEPRTAYEPESDETAAAVPERDEHAGSERHRRPVADWGGDELFNHVPRRRFTRTGAGAHTRRPSASPITSHQLRRNSDVAAAAPLRGSDVHDESDSGSSNLSGLGAALEPSLITIYEPDAGFDSSRARQEQDSPVARERRRSRRSVDERVGPRPDRIAALAFVLGLLLILLAVATADAAMLALI